MPITISRRAIRAAPLPMSVPAARRLHGRCGPRAGLSLVRHACRCCRDAPRAGSRRRAWADPEWTRRGCAVGSRTLREDHRPTGRRDTPRYRSGAWSQAFPAPGLAFVDEQHLRNSHIGVAEDVVLKRTLSVSFIAGLPEHRRLDVERDVCSLIAQTHELADGKQFERRAAKCDADMGDGDFSRRVGPSPPGRSPTLL